MKTPKLTVRASAFISIGAFLLQHCVLFASFFKFSDRVWSIYKYHGDTYDCILFGLYSLLFLVSWLVFFWADLPLSDRFLFAGLLCWTYLCISVIGLFVVSFVYRVAVGGY